MKIPKSINIYSRTLGSELVGVRPLGKPSNTVFYESIYIGDLIRKKLLEDRTKKIQKIKERIKNGKLRSTWVKFPNSKKNL